ncbi:MAG TPA: hypothetical protein VJC04_02620 [Candidatus Paceibacterota bacterium]
MKTVQRQITIYKHSFLSTLISTAAKLMGENAFMDIMSSGLNNNGHSYFWNGRIIKPLSAGFKENQKFQDAFSQTEVIHFSFYPAILSEGNHGLFLHVSFLRDNVERPHFVLHVVFNESGQGGIDTTIIPQ